MYAIIGQATVKSSEEKHNKEPKYEFFTAHASSHTKNACVTTNT